VTAAPDVDWAAVEQRARRTDLLTLPVIGVLQVDRQVRQAQRWVADPPGPARDVPAPTAVDRWTGGRRVALASLGLGLVGGLLGVLIRLVG
jgi:hypothetical protein